jgi:hypothetical protein
MERAEKIQKLKQMFIEDPNLVLLTYALLKMGMENFTFKYKGEVLTLTRQEVIEYAAEIYEDLWKEIFKGGQP